jgi:hypothetical protein
MNGAAAGAAGIGSAYGAANCFCFLNEGSIESWLTGHARVTDEWEDDGCCALLDATGTPYRSACVPCLCAVWFAAAASALRVSVTVPASRVPTRRCALCMLLGCNVREAAQGEGASTVADVTLDRRGRDRHNSRTYEVKKE